MFQRDYVLRQAAQLTQALARVLFLRKDRRHDEALQEIRHAGELFLGLDLDDARTISYADVVAALTARGLGGAGLEGAGPAADVAELFRQRGELDALRGRPAEAQHSLRLALHLYLDRYTRPGDVHAPDLAARIDALLEQVAPYTLPPDILAFLFPYYESAGRFDRAEDVLFILAERPDEGLYARGVAFYERLRRLTNARLTAGGLSREEVSEGREAFEHLFRPP